MKSASRIAIRSSGQINGCDFDAEGSGSADLSSGVVSFSTTFSDVPPDADPFGALLAVLILPTSMFGREVDDATNLLTLSGGDIEFTQDVGGDGVSARSSGTITQTAPDEFLWDSRSQGEVRIPEVASVDSFDAVMIPQGPGEVLEAISIPMNTANGRYVVSLVRRFMFRRDAELKSLQLRHMELTPEIGRNVVAVSIRTLIAPFATAYEHRKSSQSSSGRFDAQ